jgi:hypothetical protein
LSLTRAPRQVQASRIRAARLAARVSIARRDSLLESESRDAIRRSSQNRATRFAEPSQNRGRDSSGRTRIPMTSAE